MMNHSQYFNGENITHYLGEDAHEHTAEINELVTSAWRDVQRIIKACQEGRDERLQGLVHSLRNEAACIGVTRNYFDRANQSGWLTQQLLSTMDAEFLREDFKAFNRLAMDYVDDQDVTRALQSHAKSVVVKGAQKDNLMALVVDDRPNARNAFAMVIRTLGYKVKACADGKRAVEALKADRYDVLLTDLVMPPGEDGGLYVLRAIANEVVPAPRKIILATAHAHMEIPKVEGLEYHTLYKPVSRQDIQELIS